ncbi:MAG: hypothetical protein HETSPECPRED_007846 [Heterodermia speciosa]|uniref:Uncharacterized protein n=1 Tax=Heterodermia speciosa TaxID=116794 RepID=A0A8H3IXQ7_9LECA|nr:MAG: hypothetical protein HETSPECPRED_007846 [Heterodermia speciosa]
MLRKSNKKQAYAEEMEAREAAEEARHETEELNAYERGKYEGLQMARGILDRAVEKEGKGDDSDDDEDEGAFVKMYKVADRVRRLIGKKSDEVFEGVYDEQGRSV